MISTFYDDAELISGGAENKISRDACQRERIFHKADANVSPSFSVWAALFQDSITTNFLHVTTDQKQK